MWGVPVKFLLEFLVEFENNLDKWYNTDERSDSMMNKRVYALIKTIIIFICYMFYANVLDGIFNLTGISNNILSMFVGDIIFLIAIIFINKNDLKNNFYEFKKEYTAKEKIKIITKWSLIILAINILVIPLKKMAGLNINNVVDGNSMAVIQLFDIAFIYSVFKTLIFAPIAEELLFKKTIRDIVKDDHAFILISSLIYAIMNFMYGSMDIIILVFVQYFVFSLISSIAYIKNKDNIVIVMFIKFFSNLIPTVMLIATMIAGVTIWLNY